MALRSKLEGRAHHVVAPALTAPLHPMGEIERAVPGSSARCLYHPAAQRGSGIGSRIGPTVANALASEVKVIARGEFLEVRQVGERADMAELLEALLPHFPFGGMSFDVYRITRPRPRRWPGGRKKPPNNSMQLNRGVGCPFRMRGGIKAPCLVRQQPENRSARYDEM